MSLRERFSQQLEKIKAMPSSKRIAYLALIISLVMHSTVLLYKIRETQRVASASRPKTRKVVKINLKKLEKLKKKSNKSNKKFRVRKQIVNSEKKDNKVKPNTDRFLGEHNQTFDRQSIAKRVDRFKEAGKGTKKGVKQKQVPKVAKAGQKVNKTSPSKKSQSRAKKIKNMKLSDLSLFSVPTPKIAKKAPVQGQLKNLGLKNGKKGLSGLARNNDFIEDVPLGDFTRLNTQEFKFYGFYHRIRQRLEQYWGNKLKKKAEKIYRSGRRLPASENLITSLQIILDSKGNIVNVIIKGSSGVKELDDAAIEAFNNAGPFPNPPRGMVRDGRATIEWGFVVKS